MALQLEKEPYNGCMLPPPISVGIWSLSYGHCVDVYHKKSWWEGVVFDHEDGCEERLIFFPDSSTEVKIGIDMMRITQDWDVINGEWKRRGTWLFLDLVKELEREQVELLGVSVKEMWLAVQEKVRDWTCSEKAFLNEIVKEFVDHSKTVLDVNFDGDSANFQVHLFNSNAVGVSSIGFITNSEGDSSADLVNFQVELPSENPLNGGGGMVIDEEANGPVLDVNVNLEVDLANSQVALLANENPLNGGRMVIDEEANCGPVIDVNLEEDLVNSLVALIADENPLNGGGMVIDEEANYGPVLDLNLEADLANSQVALLDDENPLNDDDLVIVDEGNEKNVINPDAVGVTSIGAITSNGGGSSTDCNKIDEKPTKSRGRKDGGSWKLAGPKMIGKAKYCPNAIINYALVAKNCHNPLVVDIRKHLSYLGWKIEYEKRINVLRFRYTSPNGNRYLSLVQLCQDLRESTTEIPPPIARDEIKSLLVSQNDTFSSSKVTNLCPQHKGLSSDDILVVEPEYCPQAVVYWYLHGLDKKQRKEGDIKASNVTLKVKKHLSFLQWVFWYAEKGRKRELRYTSPSGTTYYSLRTACKACIDGGQITEWLALSEKLSSSTANAMLQESIVPSSAKHPAIESSGRPQSKKRKRKDNLSADENSSSKTRKTGKLSKSLKKLGDDPEDNQPTCVLGSRKSVRQGVRQGVRQEVLPSLPYRNPRSVLSWLLENNVVLLNDKVHYRGRNDGPPLATGIITQDGIKCNCCHKLFTLTGFEAHAGSSNHRPAANIILEDGRSLFDCQIQVAPDNMARSSGRKKHQEVKGNCHEDESDYICTVCHCGGDLILCDRCPSSFHKSCLGLKDVPDGDWFCPFCCCGICRQSKVTEGREHSTDNSVLSCYQCERKYHAGCLRSRGAVESESILQDKWFCSSKCKKIYSGLHELLGRPIPVGIDNLTWTLVKSTESDIDPQNYSKLNVALEVMHECFEPCKEAYTGRDLVEDVIFSRQSELHRLNFKGFYTVLLETKEELICVANVRIYGKKVAELPLVATKFQFRRLGMCRILVNELEKKLKELGVERLVLPAVPSVLNTWTTSFGFSKMTDSERAQFLNYIFLDFQGTIMCQKLLVKSPSTDSSLLEGSSPTVAGDVSRSSDDTEFDWSNHISEVLQDEHIEESGVVNQCLIKCS